MDNEKRMSDNKMQHTHAVAEYMYQHAKEHGLDKNDMYVLGLLHDVGYICSHTGHMQNGGAITKHVGVDERLVYAIENHGMDLNELEVVSAELLLLVRADLQINYQGEYVGYDERLKNVKERYGDQSIQYQRVLGTIEYLKNTGWYR